MSQETVDIFEYYFGMFDQIEVKPIVFIEFTSVLILAFLIRYLLLYTIEKNKNKRKSKDQIKNINMYIIGHCLIELLGAFFICYCLIKLTYANPKSYIINMICAPAVGMLLAIYLDNKIIIPIETATGIGNVFEKINNKKKSTEKSEGTNNITINIGNQNQENIPDMQLKSSSGLLSKDIVDDEDFNSKIVDVINEIKNEQSAQSEIISQNTEKLDNAVSDLGLLKESEMINKKIVLKKMIYECLNKGYATPEENDKITMYYHVYTSLGGNHEVQSLYEKHYVNLPIHTDDIIEVQEIAPSNRYYNNNIKEQKRVYLYGEFDNIIDEEKK